MKTTNISTEQNIAYDYDLQVWTERGVITDCGHPKNQSNCCNARKYRGRILERVKSGIEK